MRSCSGSRSHASRALARWRSRTEIDVSGSSASTARTWRRRSSSTSNSGVDSTRARSALERVARGGGRRARDRARRWVVAAFGEHGRQRRHHGGVVERCRQRPRQRRGPPTTPRSLRRSLRPRWKNPKSSAPRRAARMRRRAGKCLDVTTDLEAEAPPSDTGDLVELLTPADLADFATAARDATSSRALPDDATIITDAPDRSLGRQCAGGRGAAGLSRCRHRRRRGQLPGPDRRGRARRGTATSPSPISPMGVSHVASVPLPDPRHPRLPGRHARLTGAPVLTAPAVATDRPARLVSLAHAGQPVHRSELGGRARRHRRARSSAPSATGRPTPRRHGGTGDRVRAARRDPRRRRIVVLTIVLLTRGDPGAARPRFTTPHGRLPQLLHRRRNPLPGRAVVDDEAPSNLTDASFNRRSHLGDLT